VRGLACIKSGMACGCIECMRRGLEEGTAQDLLRYFMNPQGPLRFQIGSGKIPVPLVLRPRDAFGASSCVVLAVNASLFLSPKLCLIPPFVFPSNLFWPPIAFRGRQQLNQMRHLAGQCVLGTHCVPHGLPCSGSNSFCLGLVRMSHA
jgi:hypothetical protein